MYRVILRAVLWPEKSLQVLSFPTGRKLLGSDERSR